MAFSAWQDNLSINDNLDLDKILRNCKGIGSFLEKQQQQQQQQQQPETCEKKATDVPSAPLAKVEPTEKLREGWQPTKGQPAFGLQKQSWECAAPATKKQLLPPETETEEPEGEEPEAKELGEIIITGPINSRTAVYRTHHSASGGVLADLREFPTAVEFSACSQGSVLAVGLPRRRRASLDARAYAGAPSELAKWLRRLRVP